MVLQINQQGVILGGSDRVGRLVSGISFIGGLRTTRGLEGCGRRIAISPPREDGHRAKCALWPDVIRAAFVQRGELAAAVELRRLFPSVTDNVQARACARTIAGWKPLPTTKQRSVKLPRTG